MVHWLGVPEATYYTLDAPSVQTEASQDCGHTGHPAGHRACWRRRQCCLQPASASVRLIAAQRIIEGLPLVSISVDCSASDSC